MVFRRAARANPRQSLNVPVSRGGRKPGTSQYYGVRFRPDLQKWVAEIRVAEWKSVDKKVWLGTFDTEQAAARGVDLARKLLNCKKKNPFNLPCERLAGYSQKIPSYLNLHDLFDSNMFKQVVVFIKQACKDYAASFDSTPAQASELEQQEYEVITDMSEVSDMIMEMTSVSYPAGSSCCNYEVAMSSPTGSCSSGVTLVEELQAPQLEARNGNYFSTASSNFPSGDEGLVSQPWAEHTYTIWPELQDPCFLPELPGTDFSHSSLCSTVESFQLSIQNVESLC